MSRTHVTLAKSGDHRKTHNYICTSWSYTWKDLPSIIANVVAVEEQLKIFRGRMWNITINRVLKQSVMSRSQYWDLGFDATVELDSGRWTETSSSSNYHRWAFYSNTHPSGTESKRSLFLLPHSSFTWQYIGLKKYESLPVALSPRGGCSLGLRPPN